MCMKGFILDNNTDECVRPKSGASPTSVWIVYLVVFIAVTVTVGAIIYLKRKGQARRLLDG